ncbi:hypothetical protein [Cytophaga sp. FL35]|uniref:hypothetical protein n=1 Tax=Cytophaga sp. FL35 TaxID=1904456 RepID=UPI001653AA73|nr:hypothetical protein [Cytophaga sp. FL35]MBC6997303.1 hypothetical protein [Cytophaga sp. FL35]
MKYRCHIILLLTITMSFFTAPFAYSQIKNGAYFSTLKDEKHELKIDGDYLTWTVYKEEPANFIRTVGGFFTVETGKLLVNLEFNSEYDDNNRKQLAYPIDFSNGQILISIPEKLIFDKTKENTQELDGKWLFATRGPDTGQERRGDDNPRKTLKFLMDGRFQWIAYNTETFKFHGTGGGSFTSTSGNYIEEIEYFSRDDSRVGATLKFHYELKDNDWHHTGKNSKGEPMYEIWSKR